MKNNMWSNTLFAFRNIYRYDRGLVLYSLVDAATGILLPFCEILLPSFAVRALMGNSLGKNDLLWILACMVSIVLLYFVQGFARKQCVWRYSYLMQGSAHDLLAHFYHEEYSEIHKNLGQYRKLRGQMDSNTQNSYKCTLLSCKDITVGLVGSIFYLLFLIGSQWYLIFLVLLTGAAQFLLMRLAGNYGMKRKAALDQSRREYEYLLQATGDLAHGKEIRLFGMFPWLSERTDQSFAEFKTISSKIKSTYAAAQIGGLSVEFIRDTVGYAVMIFLTIKGYFTIDFMLFYVGIMRGLSAFVRKLLEGIRSLEKDSATIWEIRSFLKNDRKLSNSVQTVGTKSFEKTKKESYSVKMPPPAIEFRNITFGYEGAEALYRNFNLTIGAGEKLAIVGVNGAGKSTLVNLLCGFLVPGEGEILIDGKPLHEYDRQSRIQLFSAVFQEHFMLPATLAENVSPSNFKDREGILSCLNRVGMAAVLEKKKAGLDTKTANIGGQGLTFSGGEQQKLLLARAIYKDAPIMILDEPTSALDPVAEKQVYENYRQFAKEKTSLFISHRLASTRFCDKICLLDRGRIAEYGTHEALIDKKGLYYTMFEAQSRAYREEGADEEK